MCCPVLLVLHLHSHNGAGERPLLPVLGSIGGQQVRRERRVQRVCEEHKLELDLERGRGAGETPGRAEGFMCCFWRPLLSTSWLPVLVASAVGAAASQKGAQPLTFFFSSTLMALASLRKIALPQSRSRREVNWYHFHFLKAQRASSNSRSVHCTVGTRRDSHPTARTLTHSSLFVLPQRASKPCGGSQTSPSSSGSSSSSFASG